MNGLELFSYNFVRNNDNFGEKSEDIDIKNDFRAKTPWKRFLRFMSLYCERRANRNEKKAFIKQSIREKGYKERN